MIVYTFSSSVNSPTYTEKKMFPASFQVPLSVFLYNKIGGKTGTFPQVT